MLILSPPVAMVTAAWIAENTAVEKWPQLTQILHPWWKLRKTQRPCSAVTGVRERSWKGDQGEKPWRGLHYSPVTVCVGHHSVQQHRPPAQEGPSCLHECPKCLLSSVGGAIPPPSPVMTQRSPTEKKVPPSSQESYTLKDVP